MTRWLDEAEQHSWRAYLLMQARLPAALNRQLQRASGLSLADFDVLVQLTDAPARRVRAFELCRALQWEKSRLSHQVRRMQARELVTREDVDGDGRGAFVVLTDAGSAAIEAAAPPHVETVRRLVFDTLTRQQVATLGEIADEVLGRLAAERG